MSVNSPKQRFESSRSNLMAAARLNRSQTAKRRSSRMALNASVELSGEDCHKSFLTVRATATNLNRHGAAIQLDRELVIGSVVIVRNKRGKEVTARVVVLLGAARGLFSYGIEFAEQDARTDNFWGITFPSNA